MKKLIFLLLILLQISCGDNWSIEQQNKDDEKAIVKYLKTHAYINGSIKYIDEDDRKTAESLYKKAIRDGDGIYYYEITKGKGISPDKDDKVLVNYTGQYVSELVFDDSTKTGYPTEFKLDGVIKGWRTGIQKMKSGIKDKVTGKYKHTGKAILCIPSQQAYGKRGYGNIPANTVLIFEMELLDVTRR